MDPQEYFIFTLQLTEAKWMLRLERKVWVPNAGEVFLRKHCCRREQRGRGTQGEDVVAPALPCCSTDCAEPLLGLAISFAKEGILGV